MGWTAIEVTEENADKVSELVHQMYLRRKNEFAPFLSEHEGEIEQLPQVLKVRMEALKEVNPEKFSDSPELLLSTLAAADLIRKFPDGADKLLKEDVKKIHDKYHLIMGDDIDSHLVADIFSSYFKDVKSGAISKSGEIVDIDKSKVMRVTHNFKENGIPIDAKNTVSKFKKTTKTSGLGFAMNWFSNLFGRKNKENKYQGKEVTYYSPMRGEKVAEVYTNDRGSRCEVHKGYDSNIEGIRIVPADGKNGGIWLSSSEIDASDIVKRLKKGEKIEELYDEYKSKVTKTKVKEKAPQTPDEAKKKLSEHVEDGKKKAAGETENKAGGRTEGASNAGKGKLNTKFSSGTERNF